jgi:hypothetical protein
MVSGMCCGFYHVGVSEIDPMESRTGNISRLGFSVGESRPAETVGPSPSRVAECLGVWILEMFPRTDSSEEFVRPFIIQQTDKEGLPREFA